MQISDSTSGLHVEKDPYLEMALTAAYTADPTSNTKPVCVLQPLTPVLTFNSVRPINQGGMEEGL